MMLSGFHFAEYILSESNPHMIKKKIFSFGKNIFIPSFLLVIFFFIILKRFDIQELLFYKNWFTVDRVSKFPTWYPQTIIQMLLVFYLILPFMSKPFVKAPLLTSGLFLAISVIIFLLSNSYKDSLNLINKTPLFYLWYFVLGWFIFYCIEKSHAHYRILASLTLILCATLCMSFHSLHFYWIIFGGLCLIWIEKINLPSYFKRVFVLIAQATFTLFLFHRFFFEVLEKVIPNQYNDIGLFVFGVISSLGLWVAYTAFVRTFRKLKY